MTGDAGRPERLLVVGTGLIGTSLALAARREGYQVFLQDANPDACATARRMGAGEAWLPEEGGIDLAVVAVPPAAAGSVSVGLLEQAVAATVTHVSSVQLVPQAEVESVLGSSAPFVGCHPIAGSERSGPAHASPDLFRSRPWIICPVPGTPPAATAAVGRLAGACAADAITMPPSEHDALFAALSHVPQLVASALVSPLAGLTRNQAGLAGSGLRDSSRLADSSPGLWAEIVSANAGAVAAALDEVLRPLNEISRLLVASDPQQVEQAVARLVARGRQGRMMIAGKHGRGPVQWSTVSVVVPDEPGTLARLLADAATSGANVEDIHIDHVVDHPFGVIDLAVAEEERVALHDALHELGWQVTSQPPRDG